MKLTELYRKHPNDKFGVYNDKLFRITKNNTIVRYDDNLFEYPGTYLGIDVYSKYVLQKNMLNRLRHFDDSVLDFVEKILWLFMRSDKERVVYVSKDVFAIYNKHLDGEIIAEFSNNEIIYTNINGSYLIQLPDSGVINPSAAHCLDTAPCDYRDIIEKQSFDNWPDIIVHADKCTRFIVPDNNNLRELAQRIITASAEHNE